jgi:hypothetical protein
VELYIHSPIAFMACAQLKHRDNFTFTFTLIISSEIKKEEEEEEEEEESRRKAECGQDSTGSGGEFLG